MLYRDALNLALDYATEHDPRVVVLGEDVGFYGDNYRVTDGLGNQHLKILTPNSGLYSLRLASLTEKLT